jgi:hypothetical protein
MTGIPCVHAICAIWIDSVEPVDYVSDWYSVDMLEKAYEHVVYPILGEEQWSKTNGEHVDPPMVRIQPGRPRVVRTRGPDEPRNQYKIRKGGVTMRCRGTGHNLRTCPCIRIEAVNYRGHRRSEVNSFDSFMVYLLVFSVMLNHYVDICFFFFFYFDR